ncbi:MAG: AAA family ATPase, partial [Proteobacteria bacterium]
MNATLPLFKQPDGAQKERAPLADKLRPQGWDDFIAGPGLDRNLLRQLRQGRGRAPSLILWGPPGSGKTTLARLIGRSFACRFIEVSSVLAGVKEIREVAGEAALRKDPTILFIDEIHRLNKGQQDSFLPHVENGTFVLIGATTENPSFYLTSALLSRTRVVVLEPLSDGDMMILARRGAAVLGLELEDAGLQILTGKASRDARRLFNMLESLAGALSSKKKITREQIANFLESAGELIYDRAGEEHYNMASAFIKSMRGSNPDA